MFFQRKIIYWTQTFQWYCMFKYELYKINVLNNSVQMSKIYPAQKTWFWTFKKFKNYKDSCKQQLRGQAQ